MTQPNQHKHDSLASALAAAQGEMTNASRNATNPHFGSGYADLASLRDAVIPVLSSHGIALIQLCDGDGSSVSVTTRLLWGSEQLDCGRLTIPIAGARNTAQAIGSGITYARRYQLGSVAGVASSDDDDGNALDQPAPARPPDRGASDADKARATLKGEVGCKTREDAEACIRFATEGALGVDSLEDGAGDAVYFALQRKWESAGHDWRGFLQDARAFWGGGS